MIDTGDCIRTFTGKLVNPFNPDPDTICIDDIAHALSQLCRFGGHTKKFYSVAEHSIRCAQVIEDFKLEALMHDASEAYLIDVPRPIKYKLTNYRDIEDNLMEVIAKKYNLQYPFPEIVKEIDNHALVFEYKNLMIGNNIVPETPIASEHFFLQLFWEYTSKRIQKPADPKPKKHQS